MGKGSSKQGCVRKEVELISWPTHTCVIIYTHFVQTDQANAHTESFEVLCVKSP